jgi:hypothetical protein
VKRFAAGVLALAMSSGPAMWLAPRLATATGATSATGAPATVTTFSLATSPVTVQGYGMSLFVTETQGNTTASLIVTFSITGATGRHPTQTHSYSFSLPAGAFDASGKLTKASVETGTGMGKQGAIAMTLKKLGAIQKTTDDCGTTKSRTGTLEGAFKLVADTTFFHTVKESALPATLTARASTPGCGQTNPPCTVGTTLTSANSKRNMFLNASRTPVSGTQTAGGPTITVSELLTYVQNPTATLPATISHSISVSGATKKALIPASDLSSATLDGSPAKPYLTGGLTFTGTALPPGACSKTLHRTISTGNVKGKLVARFDSVGDRGFTAGKKVPATLIQTG